jgi:LysM repeat protein
MQRYGVEPGDTLGRIANKFGLAATTIYWANKSTLPDPQLLRLGQTLVIPPVDGLVIVVGKNDTLESIAAKYGVAIQDIIDANNLVDATLPAGQTVIIPGAERRRCRRQSGRRTAAPAPARPAGPADWSGHCQVTNRSPSRSAARASPQSHSTAPAPTSTTQST